MKRLTTFALLAGILSAPALHGEETPADRSAQLNFPLPDAATDSAPDEGAAPAPTAAEPESTEAPASLPAMPPVSNPAPDVVPLTPIVGGSLNLAQMGMPDGIMLSGGQLQGGASFTLPSDQVVTHAELMLDVRVSPEMAARNATLQLMLNGQPLGTVPLGTDGADISHFQLDIPAALMVSSNNLSFKVNDGDAMQCQLNTRDTSGITVLPASRFSWESQPLNISNDLSYFPRPFFDSMQMTPADIAIAYPQKSGADIFSTAALVSSWLGIQADYRGIAFNALRDRLPERHGIIIGHPGDQVGGLTLPQTDKPLLQVVDNPGNPTYKLLLIVGQNDAALRAAAWRLTRGDIAPQTASMTVDPQAIPLGKPYDAPRWIPTDRPVKISELLRKDQSPTVSGVWHEPLRVAFRAAPDLYLWDGETIPLQISYRFPSESWINEDKSLLSVTLNNTFLHNLPMNKQGPLEKLWRHLGGDARQERFTIPLAPYLIYGDNQLSLYFNVVPKDSAPCSVLLNNNIKSRITDDSWIDLSNTRHFSLLPNLSYFVGASFPFSRLADYSQTVLLLPEQPSETQVATLLNLAARSGNATGTALTNNRVVLGIPEGGAGLQYLRDRDVLAVSALDQKTFNQSLLANSPYSPVDNQLSVRESGSWAKVQRWLTGDWTSASVDADRYFSSSSAWRGFISYRSPWNSQRTVVVAMASNDDQLARLKSDLDSPRINAGIRGDTAVITSDNGVRSFQVSTPFPSGQMPWYMMAIWYANQHSGLLAILGLIATSIVGLALTAMFKRHARKRLSSGDGQ
ncbi:cellulose biosynthesis cyclic di-GMP-binding regulatory protein BcsB [Raoultella ornithinolytica]|uniref:cellulose biosynthesis cyclic di-GMP-binding regulatory protein BcsB n=1 Tax=Klebsiella/Raoultella group TaxID=2890311 RepID=UPI000B5AB2D3|nr:MULTISPECIES: cellulose biosynthesis cyclic di-GMP-binding regulatory protein BcsB [Klebsiella/Raoultella group]MDM9678414.1 cellulose biosynthesis cyclic di-GMP-binding regulatory protein BcsB [Raoultella planticola]AUF80398.1 Cyclic di-GMP binding protein precursor [Raoultella ornithinolytica]MBK2612557.1 cellulose biosynthesis cyclic di-GMP-binding regulatory protein BcsB [Raoultella ornithinolytica]MBZ7757459.1 cellulose biosynthesis cyclic di-GMP-binding regulatory protein BcsB [Raoulte